ncbi:hypothetical protein MSIMFB_04534 [Mycobacterium simulans]|uniref:Uncharacterized protein n=2 Tax=Mycobacterium simulans TaxID=627089 RepID=A0A7Z7INT9_9MYCO|nr:hypothetical protein MSIMFB_04534 [Mycobacterium simulans]
MAAATGPSGSKLPGWLVERNNKQAERLLRAFTPAKSLSKLGSAGPHIGGDHPKPQGLFVRILFPPFVWPTDSETLMYSDADMLKDASKSSNSAGRDVQQAANGVLNGTGIWVGESADAAYAAYQEAAAIKFRQGDIADAASDFIGRAARDVAATKKHMFNENKQAHDEIEKFLRSGSGQSLAQVAVILGVHRTTIQGYSSELQGFISQYTIQFTNHFMEGGPGGPKVKPAGNGSKPDQSTDGTEPSPRTPDPTLASAANGGGTRPAASTPGQESPGSPNLGPRPALSTDGPPPRPSHNPLTSLMGAGLPNLPNMPGGGSGGGLPMGPLQGLMGGFGGFPGGMTPPAGLTGAGLQGSPMSSLGMDFGRGLAAGASAAGAVPPVTQAPMTSLTAPIETAPMSAAPAAAPVPTAPSAAAASAPAPAPAPGVPAGGMTSYGSVLPTQGTSAAPPVGSAPAAPAVPAETGGGTSGSGPGTGLMPVAGRRGTTPARRGEAESDLEQAKTLVAEFAGAARVTDPGVDWAVAVGRNASGMPTYWVATNDGAAYIPPGVFPRKAMPVAGGHSEEFDARWFGWVNPADKAVRAAREFGDTVSAVATSWAMPSEYLAEQPVPEVATGVKPNDGPDNAAATLSAARAHRLQTVDAALYSDLVGSDESVVRDYCRELVRQLAFGVAGEGLSPTSQSVAQALVAQRWPTAQEWAVLGAEHEDALVMMACQRPGLTGLENPDQMISYTREFVRCRQLEALLCWERHGGDLLNVVYAAWVTGIRIPLKAPALQ